MLSAIRRQILKLAHIYVEVQNRSGCSLLNELYSGGGWGNFRDVPVRFLILSLLRHLVTNALPAVLLNLLRISF